MTLVEIAAMLAAVAFTVLVGYLVPVLIQLRKTVTESEQLLSKLGAEVPALVSELRSIGHNVNELTERARGGIEHASLLLHAVGGVGESVRLVHNVVRGSSGTLLTKAAGVVAGFKAVTHAIRERYRKEGEPHNGG